MGHKTRLFTYGTLKQGGRLDELVNGSNYLGQAQTMQSIYGMINYSNAFPIAYINPLEEHQRYIKGDLYEVSLSTMDYINRMESNADYTPTMVDVSCEGDEYLAIMYVNPMGELHTDSLMKAGTKNNITDEKGVLSWQL